MIHFDYRPIHYIDMVCAYVLSCSAVSDFLQPYGLQACRSPPASSVHGIFQARIPEWVAISSSRVSSQPRDQTKVSCISCIAGGFFTAWAIGEPPQISGIQVIVLYLESKGKEM